jgi:hypothetical protein
MCKILFVFLLLSVLTACSDSNREVNLQETLKKDTTGASGQIIFAQPQIIDSSHIVIYPLILEKESYSSGYSSSSGGQRTAFWNLIFYNTETGSQRLLTNDKRLMIYSINFAPPSSSSNSVYNSTNGINIFEENIFYSAVGNDYNANGQLDDDDPTYLYVSNRDGSGLRQISPDHYNISSWEFVKGSSKIIMEAQRDTNGDKQFDENDAVVPFVADIKLDQPAIETFRKDFVDSLKGRLVQIWKK